MADLAKQQSPELTSHLKTLTGETQALTLGDESRGVQRVRRRVTTRKLMRCYWRMTSWRAYLITQIGFRGVITSEASAGSI